MSALDELARRSGIALGYDDYRGEHRLVSDDTKRALLAALGQPSSDAAIDAALATSVSDASDAALPPVIVVRAGQACELTLVHEDLAADGALVWEVRLEHGVTRHGTFDLHSGEAGPCAVAGRALVRRRVVLPMPLPPGYHDLRVRAPGMSDATVSVIVVPQRCYVPERLLGGERCWGVTVQLYTLRTARDWGMGDFGDLRALIGESARMGADFVGLNPIHALFPARPEHCSPYGPSSRTFLNILYIDVADVPEYAASERAQALVASDAFVATLAQLRAADRVDYAGVAALKLQVLRELHRTYGEGRLPNASERAQAFRDFREETGESLVLHALFDSLCSHHGGGGWRSWPRAHQDPRSEAVRDFAREHAEDVEFHQYTQWLADTQLGAAQAQARASGMLLGLYRDLAVGVDADGADAWASQDLYRTGASVGAPPDALALQGQDWGLPPVDPNVLHARAYRDFIRLLRANMRHCGALRVDHVMSLMRLWWVPKGARADAGAYLGYPFDDLLGILALESERNRCMVIGEDLGTVPEQVRDALPAAGVHSYRVLYFEKDALGFKAPAAYPRVAMATVTTHDLPPLVSYWEGADLALRDRLNLFPSGAVRAQCYAERAADRNALLRALAAEGLLPHEQDAESVAYSQMSFELAAGVHAYLARSASALMAIQIDDLLMMRDPVNVPGTSTEYPNWQRKLTRDVAGVFGSARVEALCRRLGSERERIGKG